MKDEPVARETKKETYQRSVARVKKMSTREASDYFRAERARRAEEEASRWNEKER